jgi:uncharacterized membrane protein
MNMNKWLNEKHGLFYLLVVLVVATRLLPHPMNFAPIGALGLFSGAYVANKRAWLIPLAALFISDLFIGFYSPIVMLSVYISFAISAVLGRYALSQKRSVIRIGGSAVASATILFVLSNFTLWTTGLYYPMTLEGLTLCFVKAIPFYGNTLAGDLFYAAVLFGTYEAVKHWFNKEADLHVA